MLPKSNETQVGEGVVNIGTAYSAGRILLGCPFLQNDKPPCFSRGFAVCRCGKKSENHAFKTRQTIRIKNLGANKVIYLQTI